MLPLSMARIGQKVLVKDIRGGRGLKQRLSSIGIVPGVYLELLRIGHGPALVKVGESRIAMGFGVTNKILVEVMNEAIKP
ncbi:MAG: ferrous iron transport protein A [Nitrospiraceae bacterium]|nr:ferrous iron transport protein A [Nitrospiraceae bacterium]